MNTGNETSKATLHKHLKRNILLFYLYQIFSTPGWVIPILIIFFTNIRRLSTQDAMSIVAFISLFTAFLEVPTGIVADKYSKRLSVALGMAIMSIGVLTQFYFTTYYLLIFSAFLIGLGQSFRSGADQALLYDSLKTVKKTDHYGSIIARATVYQMLATGLSVYLGGRLAIVNITIFGIHIGNYFLLFALSALSILISAVFAWFMIEPPISAHARKHIMQSYTRHLMDAIRFIVKRKSLYNGLFVLVIFGSIFRALTQIFGFILQPILVDFGYNAKGIANLSTLLLVAFGGGYVIYTLLKKKYRAKQILVTTAILLAITMSIWASFYLNDVTLISTLLSGVFISIALIASQQMMNDRTDSMYRTTILSIVSLISRIYAFYLTRLSGWSFGRGSYRMAIGWIGVFVLIASFALISGIRNTYHISNADINQ